MNDIVKLRSHVTACPSVWHLLQNEARTLYEAEPILRPLVNAVVLDKESLTQAISYRLATKLHGADVSMTALYDLFTDVYQKHDLSQVIEADLKAVVDRDPACHAYLQVLLYFKGFHAVQAYRLAHALYSEGRLDVAYLLQSLVSQKFSVDIHPAAKIGAGIMLDHATGLVVGETAVIGKNVSVLHGVTLGGTGKDDADRHPKVGDNVLIGASASILGNIKIGNSSRVASGSVVLSDVPPCKTVAGVPARVVGDAGCKQPSDSMNQRL